jgi:hypothetical protein
MCNTFVRLFMNPGIALPNVSSQSQPLEATYGLRADAMKAALTAV